MPKGYNFGEGGPYFDGRLMLPHIFPPDPSGKTFYMDLNIRSSGDGSSWDEAYSTIAAALAAADTDIGLSANRAWAKRNTVYACGDGIAEALVLASEKTDLIGVGTDVGSFPKVTGNCTIGTAVVGFRIINMGFIPTSTAPVITFPAGMHGWELHGVTLYKSVSYVSTEGLLSTDSRDWIMTNTRIVPDAAGAMHTIGMNLAGTTGGQGRCLMELCFICGVEGLNVVDTSQDFEGGLVRKSTIRATNLCIDDNSDALSFIDCRLITAANSGSVAGSTIVDWNAALACGNDAISGNHNGPLPGLDIHA